MARERPGFPETIADIADADLLEMYTIVAGTEPENIENEIDALEPDNWKPGYVRLFISHSAKHKKVIGEVADEPVSALPGDRRGRRVGVGPDLPVTEARRRLGSASVVCPAPSCGRTALSESMASADLMISPIWLTYVAQGRAAAGASPGSCARCRRCGAG